MKGGRVMAMLNSSKLPQLVLALCLFGAAGLALANPFPKGDAAKGKKLHDPGCVSCHNSMFPDKNGTQLYSDDMFRKSTNSKELRGMIEFCNNRTNSGWFEEEIQHVGRYLNDSYYKFTK
jgi:mono/diheme cytochrome c family protein